MGVFEMNQAPEQLNKIEVPAIHVELGHEAMERQPMSFKELAERVAESDRQIHEITERFSKMFSRLDPSVRESIKAGFTNEMAQDGKKYPLHALMMSC
jgi:hypothetical protein